MSTAEGRRTIVMFPFMAQGHILPFMALARRILQQTRHSYTITFINTPNNITKLKSSLLPDETSTFNLIQTPFSAAEFGLPPGSDNTDTLSMPLVFHFVENSHLFKPGFEKIISDIRKTRELSLVCIISDMFFPWSAEVAHEFGIFHAIFNAGGGYGMAVLHYLWSTLPFRDEIIDNSNEEEIPILGFPGIPRIRTTHISEGLRIARSNSTGTVFMNKIFNQWLDCDGFLFNTVKEFDNKGLEYFRESMNKPVWPVGPVLEDFSNRSYERGGKRPGINWDSSAVTSHLILDPRLRDIVNN
ncbi:hypothetical protein ACFE04_006570 [Oxalis oulophora]